MRGRARGDADWRTDERYEHVAEMDAERGPGAGRRMLWIAPPVRRIQLAEITVADIGVHVQDAPEYAALEQPAHFFHRWLVAPLVPDAEHAADFCAGC